MRHVLLLPVVRRGEELHGVESGRLRRGVGERPDESRDLHQRANQVEPLVLRHHPPKTAVHPATLCEGKFPPQLFKAAYEPS